MDQFETKVTHSENDLVPDDDTAVDDLVSEFLLV